MSAIVSPTLKQIQKMREGIKDAADYMVRLDWDTAVLDSRRAFLIWDDKNELLHAIQENDLSSMYKCPFRICSCPYDHIESIITNYS